MKEIYCNQCGQQIAENDFGYLDDHLSVEKTWGYGTAIDGDTHIFDLCFECYSDLIGKFKHPPSGREV